MKRVLGIDHGQARVGLAMSDQLGMLAHPLRTLAATPKKRLMAELGALIKEHQIDTIVLGIPRNMDGSFGSSAKLAQEFCEELAKRTKCKIIEWDERLTTIAAHRALQESGRKTKNTKDIVDQVAAQMILQGWLDSQQNGLLGPETDENPHAEY
ncbi:MAG: Holliday junction resolvase RuvX [Verrucomicrobiales bacterium]